MSSTSSSAAETRLRHLDPGGGTRDDSLLQAPAGYFRWKAAIDLVFAALLVIPAGILIGVLVLLVRATSKGPGIYKQVRVGQGGRRFVMFKIRTMTADAETGSGPVWTRPHDPRVTFLGRILRKLHLDELPQIFNVLRGEMSFVGPRPERPEFVRVLSKAIPAYRHRLAVRPGITGLAQINLPPDTDLASVRRKQVLDLEYIERGDLWLDARLMACTGLRIFKLHEGFLTWILGLSRLKQLARLEAEMEAQPADDAATPEMLLQQAQRAATSESDENSRYEVMVMKPKKPR